jgi:hypothetical protein
LSRRGIAGKIDSFWQNREYSTFYEERGYFQYLMVILLTLMALSAERELESDGEKAYL